MSKESSTRPRQPGPQPFTSEALSRRPYARAPMPPPRHPRPHHAGRRLPQLLEPPLPSKQNTYHIFRDHSALRRFPASGTALRTVRRARRPILHLAQPKIARPWGFSVLDLDRRQSRAPPWVLPTATSHACASPRALTLASPRTCQSSNQKLPLPSSATSRAAAPLSTPSADAGCLAATCSRE